MSEQQHCFPLRGDESVYIVACDSEIISAELSSCGMNIGKWDRTGANVPKSVLATTREHLPKGKILDFFAGAPLHLGASPFATFQLFIQAKSTPSIVLFPADQSITTPTRVEIDGDVLVYEKDWCGYEQNAQSDH